MILQQGNHQDLAATQPPRNEGLIKFHRAEANKNNVLPSIARYYMLLFLVYLYSYSFRGESTEQRSQP